MADTAFQKLHAELDTALREARISGLNVSFDRSDGFMELRVLHPNGTIETHLFTSDGEHFASQSMTKADIEAAWQELGTNLKILNDPRFRILTW